MKIVWIGAGNVATRVALAMKAQSMNICQVYSRTAETAQELAATIGCSWCNRIEAITPDADLYIFSLKDAALEAVIQQMPHNNGLWVHTAGSMPMTLFEGKTNNYGVFYPLQTFSKTKEVDFSKIPIFIEANNEANTQCLEQLARQFTNLVYQLNSEQRKRMHLSAVFVCNFVNHLYTLAYDLVKESGVPFEVLLPLIDETAEKVHHLNPEAAQTGPAVRGDHNVMNNQLELLKENEILQQIYRLLSDSIMKKHINNK